VCVDESAPSRATPSRSGRPVRAVGRSHGRCATIKSDVEITDNEYRLLGDDDMIQYVSQLIDDDDAAMVN